MEDLKKKEAVIRALHYGNLISLSINIDGKEQPVYVSAQCH